MRSTILFGAAAALSLGLAGPASALSMKECSTKYQAAKQAGSTTAWNDFHKAECGATASVTPAPAPAPATTTAAKPAPSASAPARTAARPAAPATASAGSLNYPSAVDPKYAKESAGKARMHTCLDSYNAAKASGTLGEAKWIQKGGGYYSACNARLKS